MAEAEFNMLWEFENDQEVCINHSKEGKDFLRVEEPNGEKCDWDGKLGGGKAIWKTIVNEEDGTVQFQNTKSEGFLRIDTDGKGWIGNGAQDEEETKFKLERYGKGSAILTTTQEYKGKYRCPGSKNDDPLPVMIYTRGELQDFSTPFALDVAGKRRVIIQRSSDCNQLRVKKEEVVMNKQGGTGKFAQWKIIPEGDNIYKFKSTHTKEFLRLKPSGEIDCQGKRDGGAVEFEIEQIFDDIGHHVHCKGIKSGLYIGVDEEGNVKGFEEKSDATRLAIFQANEDDPEDEEE